MDGAAGTRAGVRQVFVVTLARSGSTLLRYLLDAHPDVTAPPELNLSALLHHAADTWHRTLDAVVERPPDEPIGPVEAFSPEAYQRARRVVDPIMTRCANLAGASVFCDKSLTTVDHLATVNRCYPKATYVFLYRYPLDMIASGIQASRWGFNAFGFAPYVGSVPGNFVAGLANYWIDKVTRMVEFERACTSAKARIYYELLCDDPKGTIEQLLDFLELSSDGDLLERTFRGDHGRGPGDYKIDYTGSISSESIGRGSLLPRAFLPGQTERIDELLAALDYPSLEAGWRGDLVALLGLKNVSALRAERKQDEQVGSSLVDLLRRGLDVNGVDLSPLPTPIEIVVRGESGNDTSLVLDVTTRSVALGSPASPADGSGPRVRSVGDVLVRVAAGDVNLAQAMHDGEVRLEVGDGSAQQATLARPIMKALGTLLRVGYGASSEPSPTS